MTLFHKNQVLREMHRLRNIMKWSDMIVIWGNFDNPTIRTVFNVQLRCVGSVELSNRCKAFNNELYEINEELEEIGTTPNCFYN